MLEPGTIILKLMQIFGIWQKFHMNSNWSISPLNASLNSWTGFILKHLGSQIGQWGANGWTEMVLRSDLFTVIRSSLQKLLNIKNKNHINARIHIRASLIVTPSKYHELEVQKWLAQLCRKSSHWIAAHIQTADQLKPKIQKKVNKWKNEMLRVWNTIWATRAQELVSSCQDKPFLWRTFFFSLFAQRFAVDIIFFHKKFRCSIM